MTFILVQHFSSIGCTKAMTKIKTQIYICSVKILVRHVASLENICATKSHQSHLQLRQCVAHPLKEVLGYRNTHHNPGPVNRDAEILSLLPYHFFYLSFTAHQDYFAHFGLSQVGQKQVIPRKNPDHPQADKLEPTPVR